VPYSRVHIFDEFDHFHRMANGGLQARHDDVQVFNFSEISKETFSETPLFKTNFYQIGLFRDVEIEVSYFGTIRTVNRRNAVVLLKPGQTCAFQKTDPNAVGYAVMFKEHFVDWRLSNSNTLKDFSILNPSFECVLFLDDDVFTDLIEMAERMHFEYRNTLNESALNILKLYAQLIIEKLNRICSTHIAPVASSLQYKTTQDFKSLVYQNVHKTKTVGDYAEMLCMTEKTLINHVRLITESTPKDFINTVILEESKAMLLSRASVDQVATYFNFADQAHFSNFFRKKTGQSPNHFKKQ